MPISCATKAEPHKIEVKTAQEREKIFLFTKGEYGKFA